MSRRRRLLALLFFRAPPGRGLELSGLHFFSPVAARGLLGEAPVVTEPCYGSRRWGSAAAPPLAAAHPAACQAAVLSSAVSSTVALRSADSSPAAAGDDLSVSSSESLVLHN
jgi:hypothetical protein